jgi:hypothetical protein
VAACCWPQADLLLIPGKAKRKLTGKLRSHGNCGPYIAE